MQPLNKVASLDVCLAFRYLLGHTANIFPTPRDFGGGVTVLALVHAVS